MYTEEGIVTKAPARMYRSWQVEIRAGGKQLKEFQIDFQLISGLGCDISAGEQIRVLLHTPQQEGDLPKAAEIYSITRGKMILRKRR